MLFHNNLIFHRYFLTKHLKPVHVKQGVVAIALDFGKISIYKKCKCQHDLLYQLKVQSFITTLGIVQHVDIYV